MEKVVWTLMVALTACVAWTSAESAVWNRGKDGLLHVSVANIPGVHNITVIVRGDKERQSSVFIPHVSVDKTWKVVIPDITKTDVIQYLIEYQLADTLHRVTGSHSFTPTEKAVTLGSERYLRRRSTLAFFDDFNGGHLDTSKWTRDVMAVGMGHFQIWSPEEQNSYVKNGMLYIKPTLTTDRFGQNIMNHGTIDVRHTWGDCKPVWGPDSCVTHAPNNRPVMSALLRSTGHIRYGRVEVIAKMPKGDWLWPAIWMMPVNSKYGPWPRSGEIDLIETTGNVHLLNRHGESVGADCDQCHIHYGNGREWPANVQPGNLYRIPGTTFADGFHNYWMDWTENHIKIGVDSHTICVFNTPARGYWADSHLNGTNMWAHGGRNAPFDIPFYLILNVAIAGEMFWDVPKDQVPWTWHGEHDYREFWQARHHWLPTWHGEDIAMKVKSVRMEQY